MFKVTCVEDWDKCGNPLADTRLRYLAVVVGADSDAAADANLTDVWCQQDTPATQMIWLTDAAMGYMLANAVIGWTPLDSGLVYCRVEDDSLVYVASHALFHDSQTVRGWLEAPQ